MHVEVIDYRNGRYQGQVYESKPHGFGCFLTLNFAFIVAEWQTGRIHGHGLFVYPNGSMLAGVFENGEVKGLSMVELGSDGMRMWKVEDKAVVHLPKNGYVLEMNVKEKEVEKCHKVTLETGKVADILEVDPNTQLLSETFLSFYKNNFSQKYQQIVQNNDLPHKQSKQCKIGFKQGLRVTIQYLQDLQGEKQYSGRDYLISQVGFYDSQGKRQGLGYSTVSDHIRGLYCQQGIYGSHQRIYKYGQNQERPVTSFQRLIHYQKSSLLFRDEFIETLNQLQNQIMQIHEYIIKPEQEAIMQRHLQLQPSVQQYRRRDFKEEKPSSQGGGWSRYVSSSPQNRLYNKESLQKAKEEMIESLRDRKSGKAVNEYIQQLYNPSETFSKLAKKPKHAQQRRSPERQVNTRRQDVLTELNTPAALYEYTPVNKSSKKASTPLKVRNKSKKKTNSKKSPQKKNKAQSGLKGVVFKETQPGKSRSPQPKVVFRQENPSGFKRTGTINRSQQQYFS